jgi:hypothetical protein
VTRYLNPVKRDGEQIDGNLRLKAEEYDVTGVNFPASYKDGFERNNNIGIVVYSLEGPEDYEKKGIRRVTPWKQNKGKYEKVVKLFYYDGHFSVVKNESRLISSQRSKNLSKKYVCSYCLNPFCSPEALNIHLEICETFDGQRINYPKPGSFVKFDKIPAMTMVPFMGIADTECMLPNVEDKDLEGKNIGECTRKRLKKVHKPIAFMYHIVTSDEIKFKPIKRKLVKTSEDHNISAEFIEAGLQYDCIIIMREYFWFPVPMRMTLEDKEDFRLATRCHLCGEDFESSGEKGIKVRDHCHFTGRYRVAAHNKCNLKARIPEFIPIFFTI